MMLFNYICFQEMTMPGNALPKIFSVPWDKAPPATPTTPSVSNSVVWGTWENLNRKRAVFTWLGPDYIRIYSGTVITAVLLKCFRKHRKTLLALLLCQLRSYIIAVQCVWFSDKILFLSFCCLVFNQLSWKFCCSFEPELLLEKWLYKTNRHKGQI